jgi:cytidylate kinase
MPHVVLSGLTAAGKTTHTRRLAAELGWPSLHATEILLGEIDPGASSDSEWFTRLAEIESMRDGGQIDDRVDELILARIRTSSALVVDSWALPWYGPKDLINIWIGSDRLSRAWKCQVSRLPLTDFSSEQCAALIDDKDQASRERFLYRYGFDLFSNRTPFDFVLDNSHLITAPTRASSDNGIARFGAVISACAQLMVGGDTAGFMSVMESQDRDLRSCIVRIGPRPRRLLGDRHFSCAGHLATRRL